MEVNFKKVVAAIYVISINTKAIMNKDNSYFKTRIYEGNKNWNHIHKAENILKHNCMMNGSSLVGRRDYAKGSLRSPIRLPIAVIPKTGVYMVPTSSPKKLECAWISYYHVKKYETRDYKTYIHFRDGTGLYLDVSESTFHNQMIRTAHLIAQINKPLHF